MKKKIERIDKLWNSIFFQMILWSNRNPMAIRTSLLICGNFHLLLSPQPKYNIQHVLLVCVFKVNLQNNVSTYLRNTHHMALKQNITMQWEKTSYEWLTPITINNFSRLLTLLFLEFQTPNFYDLPIKLFEGKNNK